MNTRVIEGVAEKRAIRVRSGSTERFEDSVAIEEPLEIRAGTSNQERENFRSVSITMRTPGSDQDLVAGFLFTEGIIDSAADLSSIEPCGPSGNVYAATISERAADRLHGLQRNFYMSSSCGVCGKASIDALEVRALFEPRPGFPLFDEATIRHLPLLLRERQLAFDATGGLHAAGLVDSDGRLVDLAEDVGRHNALDKLLGRCLIGGMLPLASCAIILSGRISFELVQKAARAGCGLLVAVSAPSTLAIDLARARGMTLVGFTRGEGFNVYSGEDRISSSDV